MSDDVRSGVAQIATGAWYDPVDAGEIGSLDKHGNPNVLTPDIGTSRLAQGCAAQTTLGADRAMGGRTPANHGFRPAEICLPGLMVSCCLRQKSRLRNYAMSRCSGSA